MNKILRTLLTLATIVATFLNTVFHRLLPRRKPTYPPIRNALLTKSIDALHNELRQGKLTSRQIVQAYIARIREVNPALNAVIEERFDEALKEADHADELIAKCSNEQMLALLFVRYPLLGMPFTVKEACAVKGLSYAVGSIHRKNLKSTENGEVVERLRTAGGIPLLVSANPEFCLSFETNTHIGGRCLNPYDLRRSCAGSSGGEGALNGSGASLFGLASDISGSIRLPALFCGVFGHKPTGGLVSVEGHYPHSSIDPNFAQYLQLGPITRFARDLPLLLTLMAGNNAEKLKFNESIALKDIKIYYGLGFNGYMRPPIALDMELAVKRGVKCFEKAGLAIEKLDMDLFQHSIEMCISGIISIKGIPSIVTQSDRRKPSKRVLYAELFRCLIGHSLYTKEAVFMELMSTVNAYMEPEEIEKWQKETVSLKDKLLKLLGRNGVLFLPTFHTPATCFNTSVFNLVGIDAMLIFNILGFPATHVPMGVDSKGLPIGFQVVAAPFQDKLCLQIAAELEGAFGGWIPPLPHQI